MLAPYFFIITVKSRDYGKGLALMFKLDLACVTVCNEWKLKWFSDCAYSMKLPFSSTGYCFLLTQASRGTPWIHPIDEECLL